MNLEEARLLAIHLIQEHLPNTMWVFVFDNAKVRAGLCRYSNKTISLSKSVTLLRDQANVRNTILHEIAHALTPKDRGHGREWRRVAKSIGCTGARCYTDVQVQGKYKAVCPVNPEHVYYKFRKQTRPSSCGKCQNRFSEKYLLIFKPV